MPSRSRHITRTSIIVVVSIVLDQLTKVLAIDFLKPRPPSSYFFDLFRFEYSENPGAFLSLGSALPEALRFWLLSIGVAISLIALLAYVLFRAPTDLKSTFGLVLLTGGGLSNLIDRLFRTNGKVVDFMNMGIGSLRTGIFNVADVFIMAGVALVLLWSSKPDKEEQATVSLSRSGT